VGGGGGGSVWGVKGRGKRDGEELESSCKRGGGGWGELAGETNVGQRKEEKRRMGWGGGEW